MGMVVERASGMPRSNGEMLVSLVCEKNSVSYRVTCVFHGGLNLR